MNKKSMVIWGIVIILLFVAAYTVYQNKPVSPPPQNQEQPTSQSQNDQKMLAPDFALKDLNGKTVKLSEYRGKIVVLNFWAVWCKYCKQEMPDFNELNKEFEKNNNAVILAVDVQEDIGTVNKFLNQNNINLNVLLDENGAVAQQYGLQGYPTTFIIDKGGNVTKMFPGLTNKTAVLSEVNKLK